MWTLGYGRPFAQYVLDATGRLEVDGVIVSDDDGWMEVRCPDEARARGAPDYMALHVAVVPDAQGRPLLYATEVRVGEAHYSGFAAAPRYRADFGDFPAVGAVLTEIERRVRERGDGWGAAEAAAWERESRESSAPPRTSVAESVYALRTPAPRVAVAARVKIN